MTQLNIIDPLIIACSGLFVWALAATLTVLSERKEMKKLQKSKDDLRESLTKHNYSLFQEKEELEKEVNAKTEEIERLTKKVATLEEELSALRANSSKQK